MQKSVVEDGQAGASLQPEAGEGALLALRGVTKAYGEGEGAIEALKGVDLTLRRGELMVVLGPSGAGKSTLLNLMGGMDEPTTGEIWMQGQDITAYSDKEATAFRRDKIGFVFQFYNLLPELTARENVALAASLAAGELGVDEALHLVGLSHRLNNLPAQMSGGEQQRVVIARAIAKRSDFLLCDEPTGALDSETGREVLGVLENLVREYGHTVVIVTHAVPIATIADRIVHLHNGRIVQIEENENPMRAAEIAW